MNLFSTLRESPSLQFFIKALQTEPSLLIEELWDAPKACLIELALATTNKNILVITGGAREERLLDDLAYFSKRPILDFPAWETLPGEEIAPSPDIVGKRLAILEKLLTEKMPHIVLAPLQSCLQKLPAPASIKNKLQAFHVGEELSFEHLPPLLSSLGYARAPVVSDKGEFAIRGGILDIFPVGAFEPYRIEFFGDKIESIRSFDPSSQKSVQKYQELLLTPASEYALLNEESTPALILDYLGKDTLLVFDDLLTLEDRYVSLKKLPGAASKYFLSFEDFLQESASLQKLFWTKERIEELSDVALTKKVGRAFYAGKEPLQPLSFSIFEKEIQTKRFNHPFREISDYFSSSENRAAATPDEVLHTLTRFSKSNLRLLFLSATPSEERTLQERLSKEGVTLPANTLFEQGYLSSGFALEDVEFALLPMTELTHRYRTRRQKWRMIHHTPPSEFHELVSGDIVVHFHQGIGKFLGTEKRKNHLGVDAEFLSIQYAEKSMLYVPIAQSHLVSRYIGAKDETPTFSTLGTTRWQKTRQQAQKAIIGYAQDLLRWSAEREIQGGFIFPADGEEMIAFENDFPFVETEDQIQAIEIIKKEMCSKKAMDRLVCGDVGYGKTEVAMRAAFKAVVDGKKQVAVLVPTTVLAMQHYDTFKERMVNFPINIACVSRFASPKEIKETLQKVENGNIDILIGTHRLISRDVHFKNLGLIVIDEEQRFGVRAKEHLKALKAGVDCITLSATPIPRTLYQTLIGAKDVSFINTPPQDRLPIKTIIAERDSATVQNALLRELSRDGQAFFIHNRVESIFLVTEELQKLLPQARIVTGHGQMSSDEIDTVFHAFKDGSADILVSTVIVENGVDIPNANTILIDRADTFGLADLYQLRGRVGRWNRPAYAYFLVPQKRELSELSRKRLNALVEASGFGGGVKIAMRDLEIRGAGDILGTDQSGQVSSIGFHLYCKLLKRTIDAMQKKISPTFYETKMEFSFNASLPEVYIGEPSLRMEIYHRLGEATSFEEVDAILAELNDRFGPPPPETLWLYHMTRLRILASQKQYTRLLFDARSLTIEQQKGTELVKETFSLKETKDPKALEAEVTRLLQVVA